MSSCFTNRMRRDNKRSAFGIALQDMDSLGIILRKRLIVLLLEYENSFRVKSNAEQRALVRTSCKVTYIPSTWQQNVVQNVKE